MAQQPENQKNKTTTLGIRRRARHVYFSPPSFSLSLPCSTCIGSGLKRKAAYLCSCVCKIQVNAYMPRGHGGVCFHWLTPQDVPAKMPCRVKCRRQLCCRQVLPPCQMFWQVETLLPLNNEEEKETEEMTHGRGERRRDTGRHRRQ